MIVFPSLGMPSWRPCSSVARPGRKVHGWIEEKTPEGQACGSRRALDGVADRTTLSGWLSAPGLWRQAFLPDIDTQFALALWVQPSG
jgi:hypothetical protein